MKRIYQSINTLEFGSCFAASLASILESEENEIPLPTSKLSEEDWKKYLYDVRKKVLHPRGLDILSITPTGSNYLVGYHIRIIDYGAGRHCFVALNNKIIHDPSGYNLHKNKDWMKHAKVVSNTTLIHTGLKKGTKRKEV